MSRELSIRLILVKVCNIFADILYYMTKWLLIAFLVSGCQNGKPDANIISNCEKSIIDAWKDLNQKGAALCLHKGTIFFHIHNWDIQKCEIGYTWSGDIHCRTSNSSN